MSKNEKKPKPGLSWQQDFERYRAYIEDLPAQIVVDWNVPGAQPSHPIRVLVRVALQRPTEEGLLAPDEQPAIDHVVGTVVDVAREGLQALYVGRLVHAGSLILAFYVPRSQRSRTELLALLGPELSPYALVHDVAEDKAWTYYAEILYPDPYSRSIMSSLRMLAVLAEKGDRPEVPRMVDHTAFFPDVVAAKAALKELVAAGFRVHAPLPPARKDGAEAAWALSFQRESDLIPTSVDAFCRSILTAILPFAGAYDGWRCAVVVDPSKLPSLTASLSSLPPLGLRRAPRSSHASSCSLPFPRPRLGLCCRRPPLCLRR